jgi:hypothetical protein
MQAKGGADDSMLGPQKRRREGREGRKCIIICAHAHTHTSMHKERVVLSSMSKRELLARVKKYI